MSLLEAINEEESEERISAILDWIRLLSCDSDILTFYNLIDGVALIKAMNMIEPGIIPFHHSIDIKPGYTIHPLIQRENLNFYIEACWKLGIPSHLIFLPSDLLEEDPTSILVKNIEAISQAAHSMVKYNNDYANIPPLGSDELDLYNIIMFEIFPEDYGFETEDIELQAALSHMIKEIIDSISNSKEIDPSTLETLNDNAFAMDSVRRVFVFLLREMVFDKKTGPRVVNLSTQAFSILSKMCSSLLKEVSVNSGGDYFTTKLLLNISFYIKSPSESQNKSEIFLHEVIRENKVWEFTTFWSEFFWDSASAAIGSRVKRLISVDEIDLYDDDQKVILYELLYDHAQKMHEWGSATPETLVIFIESISPYLDLTEEEEQQILEQLTGSSYTRKVSEPSLPSGEASETEKKENSKEDIEDELEEAYSEIFQHKITIKKQEQHIKKLEDTLTNQFLKIIASAKSDQLRDQLSTAQNSLQSQLTKAADFKTGIKEVQEMVPKMKQLAQQGDLTQFQSMHNTINEEVRDLLSQSGNLVEAEVLNRSLEELRNELFESVEDLEGALDFFLDASSTLLSQPQNTEILDHMTVVSKEFDLALSDFISVVDKVLIDLRLNLSGVVLEAIVSHLEGEVDTLKNKNQEIIRSKGVKKQKTKTREAKLEKKITKYEQQITELKNSEAAAKASETQLLAEKVKLLEDQNQNMATIRKLHQVISEKEQQLSQAKKPEPPKEIRQSKSSYRAAPARPKAQRFSVQPPHVDSNTSQPASSTEHTQSQPPETTTTSSKPILRKAHSTRSNLNQWRMSVSVDPTAASPTVSAKATAGSSKKRPPIPSLILDGNSWRSSLSITPSKTSTPPESKVEFRRVKTNDIKEVLATTASKNRNLAIIASKQLKDDRSVRQSLPLNTPIGIRLHSGSVTTMTATKEQPEHHSPHPKEASSSSSSSQGGTPPTSQRLTPHHRPKSGSGIWTPPTNPPAESSGKSTSPQVNSSGHEGVSLPPLGGAKMATTSTPTPTPTFTFTEAPDDNIVVKPTPTTTSSAGGEGKVSALRAKFSKFKEFKSDRRMRASRGYLDPVTDTPPPPPTIQPKKLDFETLTDIEFAKIFKMTKPNFENLPNWKRQTLRQQNGYLFQ